MFEKKHELFRELVREFAINEIAPYAKEIDQTGHYPEELVKKIIERRFRCVTIPGAYGGCGGDTRSNAIVTEEIARVCVFSASQIIPNSLSGTPLMLFGNEQQKQRYLRGMAGGATIGSLGITEPGAGSDAVSIVTAAEKDGDDYILSGRRCFIINGPVCDFIIVFVKTDTKAKGVSGISVFIVEAVQEGFSRGKVEDKLGIRGSKTCNIALENVRVSKENLSDRGGQGFKICMATLDSGRITVASQGPGIAQGALDEAAKFVKEGIQLGKPISCLQNMQFEIADMAAEIQCGRLLVYDAAPKKDSGKSCSQEAAMAKYYCGDLCNDMTHRALQLHGGHEFIKDYDIKGTYRDARIVSIYESAFEIQKVIISGYILRE